MTSRMAEPVLMQHFTHASFAVRRLASQMRTGQGSGPLQPEKDDAQARLKQCLSDAFGNYPYVERQWHGKPHGSR